MRRPRLITEWTIACASCMLLTRGQAPAGRATREGEARRDDQLNACARVLDELSGSFTQLTGKPDLEGRAVGWHAACYGEFPVDSSALPRCVLSYRHRRHFYTARCWTGEYAISSASCDRFQAEGPPCGRGDVAEFRSRHIAGIAHSLVIPKATNFDEGVA